MNRTIVAFAVLVAAFAVVAATFWLKPERPNIVLISIDTLRGDHFTPEYMPNTYAWARKHGTIYTNAHSSATWTRPSHVSMFTGLLPSEHGVELAGASAKDELVMLAEQLKDRGYYTAAFVGGGQVSREWNMNQGFDYWNETTLRDVADYRDKSFDALREHYFKPIKKAQAWLEEQPQEEPFFLFVHTYSVHEHWLEYFQGSDIISDKMPNGTSEIRKYCKPQLTKEDKYTAYIQAIRRCDESIQRLLELASLYGKVIFTSDHGHGFASLGEAVGHGNAPTIVETHVPLVITSRVPHITAALVSIADIPKLIKQGSFPEESTIMSENLTRSKPHVRESCVITSRGRFMKSEPANPKSHPPVPPHMQDQLKALGYLD